MAGDSLSFSTLPPLILFPSSSEHTLRDKREASSSCVCSMPFPYRAAHRFVLKNHIVPAHGVDNGVDAFVAISSDPSFTTTT